MKQPSPLEGLNGQLMVMAAHCYALAELREACAGLARPGGSVNFVRMFKPRFAKLVESGDKTQTIRPLPKRIPRRGDTLSLRMWTGKPYRSKQRVLLETKLDRIEVIRIDEKGIIKPPGEGSILEGMGARLCVVEGVNADRYAQADGFKDWDEMRDWFEATHGLPFEGVALYWQNDKLRHGGENQ
jgi:hypothetical protein